MGEFKGTPGPWCLAETESSVSFDYDEDGPCLTSWQDIGVRDTGAAVAIVLGFDEHPQDEGAVAEANAHLIAAEPDLLELAFEVAEAQPSPTAEMQLMHLRAQARAAIDKALGETE